MQKIITPTENTYTLELPDEFIGKRLKVSVEIDDKEILKADEHTPTQSTKNHLIESWFNKFTTNSNGYQFNREDANDYE